jgi:hypothetical protein
MTKLNFSRKSRPLSGGHGPMIPITAPCDETEAAATLAKIKIRAARERKDAAALDRENHIRKLMGLAPKGFVI